MLALCLSMMAPIALCYPSLDGWIYPSFWVPSQDSSVIWERSSLSFRGLRVNQLQDVRWRHIGTARFVLCKMYTWMCCLVHGEILHVYHHIFAHAKPTEQHQKWQIYFSRNWYISTLPTTDVHEAAWDWTVSHVDWSAHYLLLWCQN